MNPTDTFTHSTSDQLKAFASFLQEKCMEDFVHETLRLSRELQLPLLSFFSHLSEQELVAMYTNSVEDFLAQLLNNRFLQATLQSLDNWKANQLPGISREHIQLSDIVLAYSIRKQALLHFLPTFSSEATTAVAIMRELEQAYSRIEQYAFQVYVDIHQEELQKKNAFLQSLIENSVDGISVYDKEMRVLEWNPVLEARNHIKRADIVGKSMFDFFPAYINSEEYKLTEEVFKGHKVHLTDRLYKYKPGWYEAFNIPLFDADNKVNSYLSILRDVTERKEAEIKQQQQQEELYTLNEELLMQKEQLETANEELQENVAQLEETQEVLALNELRLREAQAIAHLGSWEYDIEKELIYWSDEMKNIFGLDNQLPIDVDLYHFLTHPEDRPLVGSLIDAAIHKNKPYQLEHRIIRMDATTRWVYTRGETVGGYAGKGKKFRATCYDVTERKEAELQLQEEKFFTQKITDTSPDIITLYDLQESKNLYASREIYTLLGFSEKESMRFKHPYSLLDKTMVHPDDYTRTVDFLQSYRTYTSSDPREIEYRIKDKNGEWQWITGRYTVFKWSEQGLPVQIIGVSRNSTERKLIEESLKLREAELEKLNKELELRVEERTRELRQSEERYRLFLSQSTEGIGRFEIREVGAIPILAPVDEQVALCFRYGFLAECNDALAAMYGYTQAQEIAGTPLATFLPPDHQTNQEYLRNFITSGYRLTDAETLEPDKEGHVKYFLNNLIGIVEEGRLVRVWCTQRDITSEKAAKEALRKSEEQLRLITDALPVLITYIDNQACYRFNNKTYEEWFGISRQAIYGMHMQEVVGEEAYASLQPAVVTVLSGERAHFEARIPYKHAGTRFVTADYIPHWEGSKVAGFYAVITDISSQKSIEEALQAALAESKGKNQQLERINADMDNFIYVASHDLRSPVVNLEAIINRLQKRLGPAVAEGEQTLLNFASEAVSRLKQTISDLTEISRAQRDIDTHFEKVSFEEVYQEVILDIAPLVAESAAMLHTSFKVNELPYARKNLRSILYNLLTNAIKYRSAHQTPEIFVATHADENHIILTVQDNGLGIPEKQRHKLFTMFKRLHTHVEGSGIGLYIMKRIVENHGGSVQVTSQEGKGSTFTILFRKDAE